jgi:ATP-dependent DNA ligase
MRYIYCPRPKGKINPVQLGSYEKYGTWIAQRKYNGTRNGIAIDADGTIKFYTRHGGEHAQFSPDSSLYEEIRSLNLNKGTEYWLDGELLNNKTTTPAYKNKIVLFDVLHLGRYLFATHDTMQRLELLADICRHPTKMEPGGLAFAVTPNIWFAPTFTANFVEEYNRYLAMPEIEGLVLKKKGATLDNLGHSEYEVAWQLRCRKPHKNYNN